MRLILAARNDDSIVVAVEMGDKPNHVPKVNRVPHLKEELQPSIVHHSPLRSQTSRTRAKLPFRPLLLNWTYAIVVDQMIIGHTYAELPLRLLPSIIPVASLTLHLWIIQKMQLHQWRYRISRRRHHLWTNKLDMFLGRLPLLAEPIRSGWPLPLIFLGLLFNFEQFS